MTPADALRDANRDRAMNEVYWPRKAPTILPKDHATLYRFAADHIGADQPIDYFEFGVAYGNSMKLVAGTLTNPEARLYGFDSFVGLPEKWIMHDVGAFSSGGHFPAIDDNRISYVKGWFQNSVPDFFAGFKRTRPVLVHIDSDLYSSALFLLTSLWNTIGDYYFIFDDFIYDEVVALRDFMAAFPVDIEFFAQTRGGGERPNPDQVFGHMKRVRFELKE